MTTPGAEPPSQTKTGAPRSLDEAEDHRWIDHGVRAGMVAYGVVHLIIAWLALQLAFGDAGGSASSSGALQQIAQEPFGGVALWLVVIGMVLLVLWRLLEAVAGHEGEEGGELWRHRAVSVLKALLYGYLAFTAAKVAVGDSSGGGTDGTTATVMALPAGQVLVGLAGLAVMVYGGTLVYRSYSEKFRENLASGATSGEVGKAVVLIGKAGYAAKGVALIIVGGLFCYAALTHDASKSGGLDQALQQVREQTYGRVLLTVVALGIGCYGVFCFARARYLRR